MYAPTPAEERDYDAWLDRQDAKSEAMSRFRYPYRSFGGGLCPTCNGSGEGFHDGAVCQDCGGAGEFEEVQS